MTDETIHDVADRDFDRLVEQAPGLVLVQFWKPGCGHCRSLLRQLTLLKEEVGTELTIVKMNVEENFQLPAELGVDSLPALALYRDGTFDRFIGGIGTKDEIWRQVRSAG
ncbi:MAG TPA: thioredoxin family protein [Nitrospira sp.]|nr:thioredoxin family protein [Nitrospira sp.]